LNQKEFALGEFLDIDGAFDNASFGSMDEANGAHGVVITLRKWIDAMILVNRGSNREEYCPLCCETWWWTVYFVGFIMLIIRRRATLLMWFCCKKASS
jgi:hypothetical protein